MFDSLDTNAGTVHSVWAAVFLGALLVTAGCAGFGETPDSSPTTSITEAPGADNPGSLAGTTTTVPTINGTLPYRFEVVNNLDRNITITAAYAANGTTAVSMSYAPETNVSMGASLPTNVAYEVEIRSADHPLWKATLAAGEGYRLVITEWGRVTVADHVHSD